MSNRWRQAIVTLALGALTALTLVLSSDLMRIGERLDALQPALTARIASPVTAISFPHTEQRLIVPSWHRLDLQQSWAYVSPKQQIDPSYIPELAEISLPRARWITQHQLHPKAARALKNWAEQASQAGHAIIVTSAYRSAREQQLIQQEIARSHGATYAEQFVAQPGHSEHQLGLAVDLSRLTPACQAAFAGCLLDEATAAWLAATAPDHGFILRYPPGKQHVTGVAPESWHFRYVGREMARFIRDSGLTFDEVIWRLQAERQRQTQ